MQVKKNYKYGVAAVTSMGVRITPNNRMGVVESNNYYMQATSAETNVLNVSASLGYPCLAMTKFVKVSPIAKFIQGELRKRNIAYVGQEIDQGGPWGYRHQFNIADSGYGLRGPIVSNDRAGEVGRTIRPEDFDCETIFKKEGVAILHLSGLIAALSEETTKTCLEVAQYAKESGTLISFDLNYRASFWKGREEELKASFAKLAALSDILIGNEEDFQLALGIEGPKEGGEDISGKIDSFRTMIERVKEQYPNVSLFANTLRQVVSANEHLWGAILHEDGQWFVEEPRPIQVMDRIGGGDGFVGGLLYSVLKGFTPQDRLGFAWATGVLATTSLNDYGTPLDEDQVWNIYKGNARVKR